MFVQISCPGAGGRRGWGRAPCLVASAILLVMVLAQCATELGRRTGEQETCAKRRFDAAVVSYEDAKRQFSEHFRGRNDSALVFAYHASVDSVRLTRSLAGCFDFTENYRRQGTELIRSNQVLQRLVVSNLRDADPGAAIALFGDDYRDFMKNDIY